MSENKKLSERLNAAKEKASLREFDVTITETLQMKVTVEAKSQEDAEQMVNDGWINSEYILDSDNFVGVEFESAPTKHEHLKDAERS